MAKSRNFKFRKTWQITGLLAAALFTAMTMISPANAGASPASSRPAVTIHTNYRQAIATGSTVHGCPYYYFCAYSGEGYTGKKIEMYYCEYYGMPFGGKLHTVPSDRGAKCVPAALRAARAVAASW